MRYLEDESTYILSNFTTGDTVTITVYKLSDNSKIIDAAACTEISTTGRFKYSFSQSISTKTEYLWVANNGAEEQQGKIILGGWPDDISSILDIENGRWKIIENQMIFYKADNITEIMRFNLFDSNGNPTEENVMERQRV